MALTRITKGVIKPNENYDTHNINSTGIITAIGANFSGNVSVGGVLTYEDVTNIDSVGIITAQSDIHVGAGISVVGVGSFGTVKVGTGITFETNGQGTFSGIVTSRGYEVSYSDGNVTHNYFKAGRIRIFDNGSHCHFRFGDHPSYAPHQSYSSSQVQRTNSWLLQNTAATRYGITWVNNDGPVNLYYSKGYAPDYSIKLSTTPIGVTVGSGVTIETSGQANFVGVTTFGGTIQNSVNILHNSGYGLRVERGGKFLDLNGDWAASGSTALNAGASGIRFYYGSSSDGIQFNIGSGIDKVRFTSAGKVGIASEIPEKQLVVRTGSGSDGGILVKPNVSYANNQDRAYLTVGTESWNGTTNSNWNSYGFQHRIKSNASGVSRITIDTSGGEAFCVENGGNIGIGTNNPGRPLHIHAADCRIRLEDAGVATDVELQNVSGDAVLTTNGASNLRLQTNNTERIRIDSNGRVGLGINNPGDYFSSYNRVVMGRTNDTGGMTIVSAPTSGGYIAFADGTSGNQAYRGMITYAHADDSMRFGCDGGLERVRITSGGNVGISSAIPAARLDVFATNGTIAQFGDPRSASFECIRIKNNIASYPAITNDSTHDTLDLRSMGSVQVTLDANNNDTGNYFRVMVNGEGGAGTERFRVTEEGFVGINSTSPRSRLDIYGDIKFSNNALISSFDTNGIGGSNIDHIWHNDASNYGPGGTWNFVSDSTYKATGNSTLQMGFVNCSGGANFLGNVGIGLTSPSTQLHLQNSSSVVRVESTNDATSARVEILGKSNSYSGLHFGDTSDHDNGFVRYYNADDFMTFGTNAAERMRITSDGRVDIGGGNEVQLTATSQNILYLHGAIVGANLDTVFGQRILLDDDDTGTVSGGDRERGCLYLAFNGNASGGNTSDETRIWNIWSDVNCNADYDNAYGVYSDVRTTHTSGTITAMRGVYGICQTTSSGTKTELIGIYGLAQPTSGSSGTVVDLVGGKFRANMSTGTSTANATDLIGVWGQIDNDSDQTQPAGGKCALFYGNFDKTTNLHNPQGIRIDTDVPNYFRGDIAIDGGGNFLPTGNHKIHLRNGTNATGIFLEQTSNQYSVIKGDSNRTNAGNAIIDFIGAWDGTEVARLRIETGDDTSNKDNGIFQFANTNSGGTLTDKMIIQANGEIAMDSAGSPTDALANLHVQNETFRVSNPSQTNSYCAITAYESGDDGDRAVIMNMSNNTPKFNVTRQGQIFGASHHYAGRARTDANTPVNHYAHGAFGFFAYSGRTDNTSAARSLLYMRAWDAGDHGDRNIMAYADSGSDTDSVNSTSDLRFVVKADGRVQGKGGHFYAGRVEHDNANPSSYYQTGERGYIAYGNDNTDQTYIMGRNVADNSFIFFSEVNDEANVEIEADGGARTDGTWSNTNADYAEMFEWSDGNVSSEERRGMTVVLDGDKIKLATDSDNKDDIIGVVSANPVIVGDSASLGWHGRYKKDAFDAPVRKSQEFLVWYKEFHEENGVQVLSKQPDPSDPKTLAYCDRCPVEEIDERRERGEIPDFAIQNNIRYTTYQKQIDTENYDRTKKYIPRQDRKEWDAIGLVGKLIVKRGQPVGSRWILMKSNFGVDPNDPSIVLDKYLVR